jgi:hypothetical protein
MTSLPHHTFDGWNFFFDVRALLNKDRGFFAGSDGNLRYACMDATFYRYEIFERPSSLKFTDAAKALPSDVRVVANGQYYGKPHCTTGPCMKLPEGEVIIAHTIKPGAPPKQPTYRHFGQWDGRTADAFQVARGDPSAVTSPTTYNHAMGTLVPMIERKVPFGEKEIRDSSGNVLQRASPVLAGFLWRPSYFGWTIYGIFRQWHVLFVLTQQHVFAGATPGEQLGHLIVRLLRMGVDDAVLADSGTSSMMLVDGVVQTTPGEVERDYTMPTGGMFRLQTLKLHSSAATLTATAASTHPNFPPGTLLSGAAGTIQLTAGGSAVDLTSLGSGVGYPTPAAAMSALGLSSPIHLVTNSSYLLAARDFAEIQSPQRVSANLKISATKTTTGLLTGTLSVLMIPGNVSSPKAVAVFDVNCLLDT